jgi:hypothetical protein
VGIRFGTFGVVVAIAASVLACGVDDSARPYLGVTNGTTLTVSLYVNGQRVGDFPPVGEDPRRPIDAALLPPLPWRVEARSPTGRLLTSMDVRPGEVTTTTGANGEQSSTGTLGRVDLSSGRLDIWQGHDQPLGPPPGPGTPGDCAP